MAQQNEAIPIKPRKRRVGKTGGDMACCVCDIHPPLNTQEAGNIAILLRALADPTRVQIVTMLAERPGEVCVCDITSSFDLDQSTISHHLRLLRQVGIIDSVRHGVWVYYFLRQGALSPVIQLLKQLERSETPT
ncbi:MAG TPA: metalloregulator ArsR/SmtB family transcription factor [Ktedonobacteraceae bacterium]|nr:metalloregulator ArsR/SmtB family transcription factor [Ktedonobacteraceae bacterium]